MVVQTESTAKLRLIMKKPIKTVDCFYCSHNGYEDDLSFVFCHDCGISLCTKCYIKHMCLNVLSSDLSSSSSTT